MIDPGTVKGRLAIAHDALEEGRRLFEDLLKIETTEELLDAIEQTTRAREIQLLVFERVVSERYRRRSLEAS